jgi:hypothetical protein
MLRMCVYMHSRFVENHPIGILEDGPLISEGVLSHVSCRKVEPGAKNGVEVVICPSTAHLEPCRAVANY